MAQNLNSQEFIDDPFFGESQADKPQGKKSFDFVLWIYRILKYWYLFVASICLFMGYAYLQNKKWTPAYKTSAVLMLEPRGNVGVGMGAIPIGSRLKNIINQQMTLNSYEMIVRTVKHLPQMRVDYFVQDKFKLTNMYGMTPLVIDCQWVASDAYRHVYTLEPIDSKQCRIYYNATETTPGFSMIISYGEQIPNKNFFIKINKVNEKAFNPQFKPFQFRFVTENEMIARYSGSVNSSFLTDGSTALTVFMGGGNSKQNEDFLNALLNEFQEYNLLLKNQASERAIRFIDRQLNIIQDSLQTSEEALRQYQAETGIYEIKGISNEDLDKNKKLQSTLKIKEGSLLYISEEINNSILEGKPLPDLEIFSDSSSLNIGVYAPKLPSLFNDYNSTVETLQSMGKSHPFYDKYSKDLKVLQTKILTELRLAQGKMQMSIEDAQNENSKINSDLLTLPAKERKLAIFQNNYQTNGAYTRYLTLKKRDIRLEEASNIPDNYILERPRSFGPTNAGIKTQIYYKFFMIGLVLPLIFVFCKEEWFNFTIATKEECERITGLPVLGTVENISKKMPATGDRALVKNFPKSSFAESFRNMRIRIEYMAQREVSIAVLVTSAEPGDGKTFIAANIASVYQLTGKKVILVDFDLRRPAVSNLLKLQGKGGISNYLIGQLKLDDIIITHPEYGFDVLPAGTLPPNPSELIKNTKTKDLIAYLKSEYDYVIIDCSPIGLVSDALVLSKSVDTTLFVVRRAKTNKSFFKSVVSQMIRDGLNHAAIVFNDVKGREGYYGTSRYYGDKTYYLKHNSYYHDDYFEK